ncbi:MAG: ABC transporter permease [Planctomycetota bacterium]
MLREGLLEAGRLILSGDARVFDAALRTLWVSVAAVAIAAAVGIPLGCLVARREFPGRRALILCARTAMAFPTAFIGILCYSIFARYGVLGDLKLIYTSWAIVAGELLLALPIVFSMTQGSLSGLDRRVAETARTLGAGPIRTSLAMLSESRTGVLLGILTALARCMTELGIAVMVGGNIPGHTRTLAGAIVLETSRGEYERGLAMGLILLLMALGVTGILVILSFERGKEDRT